MCTIKAKRFNIVLKTLPQKGAASTYILYINITWFFLRPREISKELILRKIRKRWFLFALIAIFSLTGLIMSIVQTEAISRKRLSFLLQTLHDHHYDFEDAAGRHPSLRFRSKNRFSFGDIKRPTVVWNPGSFVDDNSETNKALQCKKGKLLLILVTSAPQNYQKRRAIRETWAVKRGEYADSWQHLFLIGRTDNATLDKEIVFESQKYGDILLGNYTDTYRNLTVKVLSGFMWAEHNCKPSFILKTDDDCYVNTLLLPKFLQLYHKSDRSLYVGNVFLDAFQRRVVRRDDSPWSVSEEQYAPDVYPMYASGLGYLISQDVVREIISMSSYIQPFSVEDAYIGVVVDKIGVVPKKSYRFTLHSVHWTICNFLYLFVVHHVEGQEQHKMHDTAVRATNDCNAQEFVTEWE
ncbi:beta-1,3-galactosyltransferase 5-like [Lineus longissimus]|uniref:beta-1,3-galactosyltransferase 5-like n=1 Tax=Lineus longissimus TaxID=88925 RepID=UPI002B4F9BCF